MKKEPKFVIGDLVVFRQDRTNTVYEVITDTYEEARGHGFKIMISNVEKPDHREQPYVHLIALAEPIMQFFRFAHLPEPLQEVSRPFGVLAQLLLTLPRNPERTVALRKLLEAKDAAVRAAMYES